MRAVLQRARSASVTVAGEVVGSFEGAGLVILLGVSTQDTGAEADALAAKVATLRMLDGEASLVSAGAPALVVSQFTLYGDVRKGWRPSWTAAARPEQAEPLYERFMAGLEAEGGVEAVLAETPLAAGGVGAGGFEDQEGLDLARGIEHGQHGLVALFLRGRARGRREGDSEGKYEARDRQSHGRVTRAVPGSSPDR